MPTLAVLTAPTFALGAIPLPRSRVAALDELRAKILGARMAEFRTAHEPRIAHSAFVQGKATSGGVSPVTLTFDNPVGAGNFVILGYTFDSNTAATVFTDNALANVWSNTYLVYSDEWDNDSGRLGWMRYLHNVNAFTSVTGTFTGGANMQLIGMEFSGVLATDPIDQKQRGKGSGTTLLSGTTPSPRSDAVELLCGLGFSSGGGPPYTAGGIFTLPASTATTRTAMEYAVVSSVGSEGANFGMADSVGWGAMVATFKASAAAGGQPTARRHSNPLGRERQHLRSTEIGRDRSIVNRRRSTITVPELPASLRKAA